MTMHPEALSFRKRFNDVLGSIRKKVTNDKRQLR